jgi:hypothetical protein
MKTFQILLLSLTLVLAGCSNNTVPLGHKTEISFSQGKYSYKFMIETRKVDRAFYMTFENVSEGMWQMYAQAVFFELSDGRILQNIGYFLGPDSRGELLDPTTEPTLPVGYSQTFVIIVPANCAKVIYRLGDRVLFELICR